MKVRTNLTESITEASVPEEVFAKAIVGMLMWPKVVSETDIYRVVSEHHPPSNLNVHSIVGEIEDRLRDKGIRVNLSRVG